MPHVRSNRSLICTQTMLLLVEEALTMSVSLDLHGHALYKDVYKVKVIKLGSAPIRLDPTSCFHIHASIHKLFVRAPRDGRFKRDADI